MNLTDPIADMLTRIRNAAKARKKEITLPTSRIKVEIAKILKEEGFIRNYKVVEDKVQGSLNITLKYTEDNRTAIAGLRRISTPGCRIYCTKDSVPKALDGLGLVIVTTSRGLMSGRKCEEIGVGGEVLCSIW
ncbi:MAG TPA: 30S ribosomal protein S8 [Acidobacteriota bacterium]|nr:30S ribosomal protein S8 [Acidobacteriota bacterium]